ncbi:MAG: hypothetical protein WDO68_10755 [Gammaproteobacteria bacterium]
MSRRSSRRLLAFAALTCAWLYAADVQAGVVPAGDATYVHVATAGETYRGALELRNQTNTRAVVKLRQTDYSFRADGSTNFGPPGALPRSNAGWLHLDRDQIVVAPQDTVRVEYEVRVPDDARLAGTYWSVVMVEEAPVAEVSGRATKGPRLRQNIRYAIQVITELGDSGRSEVAFHDARLVNDAGRRLLDVDVENTGDRWLRTSAWIELHDTQGRLFGRFPGARGRTFPGSSTRGRFDLTAAPPGKYLALLVVDGGRNDLFGTQIELDLR